jgi:RHS repeat-associated protein
MGYNEDNQITTLNNTNTLGYDLNGNMTTGPLTNNAMVTYGYDARNRLLAAGGLNYGYDPAGNRTSVTNGTNVVRFVVNPNASLPQTLIRIKPDGSKTLYAYGLGLLYEVNLDPNGAELNTRTYHYDYRGSTVALTDDSGMPTNRVEYSPYGLTTYRTGTNDTPFLYNGRYGVMTDPNGLLYMRARYYNPYLCRFINPDPSGFGGGLNWYCYADGDPISMVDPFGLGALESAMGSSWVNQIATGLGFDTSIAAQDNRESLAVGAVSFATLGAANDVTTALTGYDMAGNRATSQEQGVATVMAAMNFLPVGRIASAATRLGVEGAELAAKTTTLSLDTATTWGRANTLADHFARHGADFGAQTADEYANMASQFFQNSQRAGLPTKIDSQGVIRVFDPQTGAFGSFNPSGTTRTFFKPPNPPAYFGRQPGTLFP